MSILGSDGKPIISDKDVLCPKCGRGPKEREPSGSFGRVHLVCRCGYEFINLVVSQPLF